MPGGTAYPPSQIKSGTLRTTPFPDQVRRAAVLKVAAASCWGNARTSRGRARAACCGSGGRAPIRDERDIVLHAVAGEVFAAMVGRDLWNVVRKEMRASRVVLKTVPGRIKIRCGCRKAIPAHLSTVRPCLRNAPSHLKTVRVCLNSDRRQLSRGRSRVRIVRMLLNASRRRMSAFPDWLNTRRAFLNSRRAVLNWLRAQTIARRSFSRRRTQWWFCCRSNSGRRWNGFGPLAKTIRCVR